MHVVIKICILMVLRELHCILKKNQNSSRPSEHSPVRGGGMSKRLGGIVDLQKNENLFPWHLDGFPGGSNIGSTV